MSFESRAVRDQCSGALDTKQRKKLLSTWDKMIERRAQHWQVIREKERQSTYQPQLDFVSGTCEYGGFLSQQIRNPKGEKGAKQKLDPRIPWLGPKFFPPTYASLKRRKLSPDILPDVAFLKAVTLLHPVWFDELNYCPRCNATGTDLYWNGWTTSGPRDVHGVSGEEQVIGVQMRCKKCKEAKGKGNATDDDDDDEDPSYCWGTASYQFWEKKQHWEIPIGVPHIKWRSAVTSELYDLIVEFRPSMTSAGLAEHIKQLHLLEYHKRRREYLVNFEARANQQVWPGATSQGMKLQKFSEPRTGRHQEGYDNTSISDEQVTEIYLDWVRATRQGESEESLRTKAGIALSLDATFRTASKATVVDHGKTHSCVYKGGITTILNEDTLILAWRFCFTQGNWELQELLKGLKHRLELLGVSGPEMVISDCCCHVAKAIHEVFPDAVVCLDVWHFLMRYLVCLVGGSRCPVRAEVARDIVDAVLKCRALDKTPAVYWSKEEQEGRLEAAFKKWDAKAVWTAAGAKAHQEQLGHVRKGCLARPRDDVRADGSRIEGSHKGWNALQRSFSSGLEMMAALGHDFVLRHNTRVESALKNPSDFTHSTFSSHHIRLVNDCAQRWNKQLARKDKIGANIEPLPVLDAVRSGETFGMIKMSPETAAHQSLTSIKNEPVDEESGLLNLSSQDLLDPSHILAEIGIDPSLLYQLPQASTSTAYMAAQPDRSFTPHPCARVHDTGLNLNAVSSPLPPPPPLPDRRAAQPAPSITPHPRATTYDTGVDLTLSPLSGRDRAMAPPVPSLPDPLAFQFSSRMPPTVPSSALAPPTPSSDAPPSTRGGPPVDITDIDALYDSDNRDQKAVIIQAAEMRANLSAATQNTGGEGVEGNGGMPRVDRKGKGVDRSALEGQSSAASTRKRRAQESGDIAPPREGLTIEISSDDESEGPSQPKPPPRKRLRLHVPGTPAAAKAKPATAPSDSTSVMSTAQMAAPSTNVFPGATLDSFFQSQSQSQSNTPLIIPNTTYFPRPIVSGLTRSQHIFSVASGGIDPRSLSLASIDFDEFKLFLQLRAWHKWTTYAMSPYHWVCAASVYNQELEKLNQSTRIKRPLKTPRALMDKLFQLEPKLIARIISENYESHSGRSPRFWYPHCHAFPLEVGGRSGAELTAKLVNGKKVSTKVHRCHRCKRVMYPGPVNSPLNHPRGVCTDQVWQSARMEKTKGDGKKVVPGLEEPPPFPQPGELFTSDKHGHYFHADRLLKLLHDFYLRIIAGVAGSGSGAMYDIAFAQLLQARVKILDATPTSPMVALFRPYRNVKTMGISDGQTYAYCGEDWIRVDYLSVNINGTPQTVSGPSQPQPAHAGPSDSHLMPQHTGSSQSPAAPSSRAGSSQPDRSRAGSVESDVSPRVGRG